MRSTAATPETRYYHHAKTGSELKGDRAAKMI